MNWHELYSAEVTPTSQQIRDYIDNPLWQKLNNYLQLAYKIKPILTYSGCSMQAGWNIKYKKSGKSLCTLYPMQGYFIALVVIGAKEMHHAEELMPFSSDYVQNIFSTTKLSNGQKWLMLDVKDEATVKDIIKLIALRVKSKNA